MPNLMAALPIIGGALCSTSKSLAHAHYYRLPCSIAVKTRNPLKFAGVPQTTGPISAASRPKFAILWGHVEEILLLNKIFSDCRYVCRSMVDIQSAAAEIRRGKKIER